MNLTKEEMYEVRNAIFDVIESDLVLKYSDPQVDDLMHVADMIDEELGELKFD